jgi:hypothetical protein
MQRPSAKRIVVVGYILGGSRLNNTALIKHTPMLLSKGEVTVENMSISQDSLKRLRVNPGSLIGELSLIDGLARTASHGTSHTAARVLSRQALEQLSRTTHTGSS